MNMHSTFLLKRKKNQKKPLQITNRVNHQKTNTETIINNKITMEFYFYFFPN